MDQDTAGIGKTAAAANAPVETGRLRGSIRASVSGLAAEVSAGCEYAAAVELLHYVPTSVLNDTQRTFEDGYAPA